MDLEAAARAYAIGDIELGLEVERRARRLGRRSDIPAKRLGLDACVGDDGAGERGGAA